MDDEVKLDQAKVDAMAKKFDEQYGETVLSPDNYNSPEELQALLDHNEHAKLKHAERREMERLNEPGLISKFKKGIKKLFGLNQAKQKQIEQNQQNTR
ncbi:MAG: hypothetical protein NC311_00880 [Muribaculaceae bacterium]|nr:hypothetical protein [Muribaculaceae bacterium]